MRKQKIIQRNKDNSRIHSIIRYDGEKNLNTVLDELKEKK